MTWRERRIITLLSTVLLILSAAVLIALGIRYRQSRAQQDAGMTAEEAVQQGEEGFSALYYSHAAATLSFSRNESGAWQWDGNTEMPLDDTVITQILELVTTQWSPQQTLTDPEVLESSGLDAPVASLTATTATGAATSLLFGKTTTDGNSYYVRRDGDERTVYIISDTLYQLMQTPVYDMCSLPQLPALQESDLVSIAIRGAATEQAPSGVITVLTAQRAEGSEDTTWRFSGANVTDEPEVRALLEDVTALQVERCVDFAPSEEAGTICGFDAPAAILEITYNTEGDAEQVLTLRVGERLPDGSGRYTRLGEDAPIYLVTTDLLDPLMRLAAEGLEA